MTGGVYVTKAGLFTADTVEQAIEIALKQLNTDRSQVKIEVLAEPKRSFFGRKQKAEIRVTLLEEKQEEKQVQDNIDGQVWIASGEIKYKSPKDGGRNPIILFDKLIDVTYNGCEQKLNVELDNGIDGLEIRLPPTQKPKRHAEIDISPDKMEAYLQFQLFQGVKYRLKDCAPNRVIQLELDYEPIISEKFTKEEIAEELAKAGITYGIDYSDLTDQVLKEQNQRILIARGTPPIPPIDGYIEYLFKQEQEAKPDLDAERIDFYEFKPVLSVEADEILAKRTPGKAGKSGINIFGETITVAKPKEPKIVTGEGVRLSDDQLTAYSIKPGLPVIHNGVLRIIQVYELRSDANLETGNVRFNGEVIIHGNVCERVKVKSYIGGVQIYGMVDRAVIEAERDILISRNAIASQLIAGGYNAAYIKLASYLQKLRDSLQQLLHAFEIVESHQSGFHHGTLLKNIIELKFNHIPTSIAEFDSLFSEIQRTFEPDFHTLILELKSWFLDRGPLKIDDVSIIERLISQLDYWETVYKNSGEEANNITAAYLHNCTAQASGIVKITGQGAYYSEILAGKGYYQKTGVFRGGNIIVNEGDILLKELGGPTGIITHASIISSGKMTIGLVYPNVTVSIKNQKYNFLNQAPNVRVFLTSDGLTVYSGSSKLL